MAPRRDGCIRAASKVNRISVLLILEDLENSYTPVSTYDIYRTPSSFFNEVEPEVMRRVNSHESTITLNTLLKVVSLKTYGS